MVLHITAPEDFAEESRAAALSFWEQLQSYALRDPAFRERSGPGSVAADAPDIVREMVSAATAAGVGPMFTFQGAVVDQVGRFLARADARGHRGVRRRLLHPARKKRMKLAVKRRGGEPITVAVVARRGGRRRLDHARPWARRGAPTGSR